MAGPTKPCHFLKKIPRELRDQIYGHLVTSRCLQHHSCINRDFYNHEITKLGLHPNILRANRQIYEEAARVMYETQAFRVECLGRTCAAATPIGKYFLTSFEEEIVAISRHLPKNLALGILSHEATTDNVHEVYMSLNIVPAAKKVKNWILVITHYNAFVRFAPAGDLVNFCRAIADFPSPPRSLTVLLIPQGMERQDPGSLHYEPDYDNYHKLKRVVNPLKLLRGLDEFSFREATEYELPSAPHNGMHGMARTEAWRAIDNPRPSLKALEAKLKELIVRNEPVEFVFKMNRELVAYAQAFERHEPFRNAMDNSRVGAGDAAVVQLNHWSREYRDNTTIITNPYRCLPHYHPVEQNLDLCAKFTDINDAAKFKIHRQEILRYLEPQYQRIMAASTSLLTLIKYQKQKCGYFEAAVQGYHECNRKENEFDDVSELMMMVDLYAAAFARDAPYTVKHILRKEQANLMLQYGVMPREENLARLDKLHRILESSIVEPNFMPWVAAFQKTVDELDEQMLAIRAARRELFKHDLEPKLTKYNPEIWRCDEPIDWTINEPDITVRTQEDTVKAASNSAHYTLPPFGLGAIPAVLPAIGTAPAAPHPFPAIVSGPGTAGAYGAAMNALMGSLFAPPGYAVTAGATMYPGAPVFGGSGASLLPFTFTAPANPQTGSTATGAQPDTGTSSSGTTNTTSANTSTSTALNADLDWGSDSEWETDDEDEYRDGDDEMPDLVTD